MIASWMSPEAHEVYARREEVGCGLRTANLQLVHARINAEMPRIREERDFDKLLDVVSYLLGCNQPSTY